MQRGGESFSRKRDRAKLLRQQMNDGLDSLHEVSIYAHSKEFGLSLRQRRSRRHTYILIPRPCAHPPLFSRNTWWRTVS